MQEDVPKLTHPPLFPLVGKKPAFLYVLSYDFCLMLFLYVLSYGASMLPS